MLRFGALNFRVPCRNVGTETRRGSALKLCPRDTAGFVKTLLCILRTNLRRFAAMESNEGEAGPSKDALKWNRCDRKTA